MNKKNDIVGVIGTFLVGGLWVAALYDYLKAPTGLNQGMQIGGTTILDSYAILTGQGAPVQYANLAGASG